MYRFQILTVTKYYWAIKLAYQMSQSPFSRQTWQNFHLQSFATPWMCGCQASHLQDGRCSTWKGNMLNSAQNKILFQLLLITSYNGTHTQGKNLFQTFHLDSLICSDIQWFYVHNLKTVHRPWESDCLPKSSRWSPLSQLVNFASSHSLATTLEICQW